MELIGLKGKEEREKNPIGVDTRALLGLWDDYER
jgi:hypothetical protein